MGNSTSGSSAVAGIGIASVSHQIAIRVATAAVLQPNGSSPGGAGRSNITRETAGPAQSPMRLARPGWASSIVGFTQNLLKIVSRQGSPVPLTLGQGRVTDDGGTGKIRSPSRVTLLTSERRPAGPLGSYSSFRDGPVTDKDLTPCPPATAEITELMMPMHVNNLGNVFGGFLLSMVDKAGALAAMRHARGPCVTVSVDRVEFKLPIYAGELVTCKARVTFVGRSSMEIWVHVEAEHPMTGEVRHTNDCYLTFVAIDADGRPIPVRGLVLENDEDERHFEQGGLRRRARQTLDAQLEKS